MTKMVSLFDFTINEEKIMNIMRDTVWGSPESPLKDPLGPLDPPLKTTGVQHKHTQFGKNNIMNV